MALENLASLGSGTVSLPDVPPLPPGEREWTFGPCVAQGIDYHLFYPARLGTGLISPATLCPTMVSPCSGEHTEDQKSFLMFQGPACTYRNAGLSDFLVADQESTLTSLKDLGLKLLIAKGLGGLKPREGLGWREKYKLASVNISGIC